MSSYLPKLKREIALKWAGTYNKVRESQSNGTITSFGFYVSSRPCWYLYAEFDGSIICTDLFVIEQQTEPGQIVWFLTSAAPADIHGVTHIQRYWIRPDEEASEYETIYFKPGENPDREKIAVLSVKQVVTHMNLIFYRYN